MKQKIQDIITSEDELREIIGYPSEMNLNKVIPILDEHCKLFIEHSPFMLISTSDGAGNLTISPKGDPAGFVHVLDDKTLAIPDRIGNRRIDSISNLLQNDYIALLFMIPGKSETLRISGRATIARDQWLREHLAYKGKLPNVAIVVTVDKAYMHCSKCIIRSDIWNSDQWQTLDGFSSLAQVLIDHANLTCSVEELQDLIDDSYTNKLY